MRFCEHMYMLQGMQFCKYPDFECKYQSEKYLMHAKICGEEITSVIKYCKINSPENLVLDDVVSNKKNRNY